MFKKSEIDVVVKDIRSVKNPDIYPCIVYDTSDFTIWVDFNFQNEQKRYRSNTIHKIRLSDYHYHTPNLKKVNTEDLIKYMVNILKLQVDTNG